MFQRVDTLLLGVTVGLVLFGLAMIASVSVFESYQVTSRMVAQGTREAPSNAFYLLRDFWHVLSGLGVLVCTTLVPYRLWERMATPLFFISLALLLAVFLPGVGAEYGTSRSWLNIGPFSLQPIECLKLTMVFYLATWFQKREQAIGTLQEGFLPFVTLLGICVILIALQPDFGGILVITGIAAVMFFIAGGNVLHLCTGAAISTLLALPITLSEPYVRARFTAFLHPDDPLIAETIGFQIKQALIAIGSGQWFGVGYGKSIQKFGYLPEVQSDTIFAAMGEELGFIRLCIILGLYSLLIFRGFRIAQHAPDRFGMLVAAGITSSLAVQTIVNIGANLALLPLTGITLPLVSYGGSSLWASLAGIGILLSISRSIPHEASLLRGRFHRAPRPSGGHPPGA